MLLCLGLIIGGTYLLQWYIQLPDDLKQEADQQAIEYASQRFGKALDELDQMEASDLIAAIQPNFIAWIRQNYLPD